MEKGVVKDGKKIEIFLFLRKSLEGLEDFKKLVNKRIFEKIATPLGGVGKVGFG